MPPPMMIASSEDIGTASPLHHGGHRGYGGHDPHSPDLATRKPAITRDVGTPKWTPIAPPCSLCWRAVRCHSTDRTRSSSIAMNVDEVLSEPVRLRATPQSRAVAAAW